MALVDCDQTPRPSKAVDVPRLSIQEIVENIYRIINEHSLQDLIELSNIIGSYRSFLDERVIWEAIYQRSTRPRPPGPYDWQSTSELAQALINSAKVTVNWPEVSNYPKVISRRYIPVDPDAIGLSVLFDRWIMYAVGSKLLWYGLDSDHGDEKILFDAGEGRRIECLRTTGKILYNGRAAAFALIFVGHEMMIAKIRFAAGQPLDIHTVLRTQLHGWDASSQLTNVFLHHRLLIVAVAYGDESLCQKQFVIDARTLCQYHLAKSAWDKAVSSLLGDNGGELTFPC
ncbi:hypothetical protein BS17DRAFT_534870 [Gyrodon lividus]|nr:hypothetical protein BS17DRAFT_534870 [Gyrodon lividus]